jgi:4-diphosphocytidyl-2-C-methyl-D-erythritol kinase
MNNYEIEMTAYAKVNLALAVTSIREDGYHNIQTIFQSISLFDTVKVKLVPEKGIRCFCGNLSGENNLGYKIAELFIRELRNQKKGCKLAEMGIEITIEKHIPQEDGLGGGRSDAATVLRALNILFDGPFTYEELLSIAANCGSDTAFCLDGGTQWGEGTGVKLEALPQMPPARMILVKPPLGVNTGSAYRMFDAQGLWSNLDKRKWKQALEDQNMTQICSLMQNSLEEVSIKMVPEIGIIKGLLMDAECMGILMSGSGSAVFGIIQDMEHGKKVKDILKKNGFCDSWIVHTVQPMVK